MADDLRVVESQPLPELSVVGSAPLPGQEQPGFFSRAWQQLGALPTMAAQIVQHPLEAPGAIARGMFEQPGIRFNQGMEELKKGNLQLAAGRFLESVPVFGFVPEAGDLMAQDIRNGNYKGAIGTFLGLIATPATYAKAAQATPAAVKLIRENAPAITEAAKEYVPAAVRGAYEGAMKGKTLPEALITGGLGFKLGGPAGATEAAMIPAAIRATVGATKAVRETAATRAAAAEAARAARAAQVAEQVGWEPPPPQEAGPAPGGTPPGWQPPPGTTPGTWDPSARPWQTPPAGSTPPPGGGWAPPRPAGSPTEPPPATPSEQPAATTTPPAAAEPAPTPPENPPGTSTLQDLINAARGIAERRAATAATPEPAPIPAAAAVPPAEQQQPAAAAAPPVAAAEETAPPAAAALPEPAPAPLIEPTQANNPAQAYTDLFRKAGWTSRNVQDILHNDKAWSDIAGGKGAPVDPDGKPFAPPTPIERLEILSRMRQAEAAAGIDTAWPPRERGTPQQEQPAPVEEPAPAAAPQPESAAQQPEITAFTPAEKPQYVPPQRAGIADKFAKFLLSHDYTPDSIEAMKTENPEGYQNLLNNLGAVHKPKYKPSVDTMAATLDRMRELRGETPAIDVRQAMGQAVGMETPTSEAPKAAPAETPQSSAKLNVPVSQKTYYHSTGKSGANLAELDRPFWITPDFEYAQGVGGESKTGQIYKIDLNAEKSKIADFPSRKGYTEASAEKALRKTFPDISDQEIESLIDPGSFPSSAHDLSHMIWETGGEDANALLAKIAKRNGYQAVRMFEKEPGAPASYRPRDPAYRTSEVMLVADPKAVRLGEPVLSLNEVPSN